MRQVLDFILDADVYSLWQVTLNINVFILQLFIPPITLLETFLILLSCDFTRCLRFFTPLRPGTCFCQRLCVIVIFVAIIVMK